MTIIIILLGNSQNLENHTLIILELKSSVNIVNKQMNSGKGGSSVVSSVTIVMYFIYVTTFSAAGPKRLLWVINQKQLRTGCLVLLKRICLSRCSPPWRLRTGKPPNSKPLPASQVFWIEETCKTLFFTFHSPPVRAQGKLLGHRLE